MHLLRLSVALFGDPIFYVRTTCSRSSRNARLAVTEDAEPIRRQLLAGQSGFDRTPKAAVRRLARVGMGFVNNRQGRQSEYGNQEYCAHAGRSFNIMVEFWPRRTFDGHVTTSRNCPPRPDGGRHRRGRWEIRHHE